MRVYSRTIPYTKPGETFTLVPISDVHYGAAACEKNRFISTLRKHGKDRKSVV